MRYVFWHWRLMKNLKKNWLVFSKMTWKIWQILVYRLANSDFILESKMAELNENKNSKQPDAVWKNYQIKNLQIKPGQCDSIIFPKNIFFWRLQVIARPLTCWQQDSIAGFWQQDIFLFFSLFSFYSFIFYIFLKLCIFLLLLLFVNSCK